MKLTPYLHFQGNCEEALNTYAKIFNGVIGQINRYDHPAFPVADDYKNKIMHTQLTFGENVIMLSDSLPGNKVNYGNGIALSINLTNLEETTAIFNKLAEDGSIIMPLEKQFWGSHYGEVTDSFGIRWMLICE
jgi:PhnB protein